MKFETAQFIPAQRMLDHGARDLTFGDQKFSGDGLDLECQFWIHAAIDCLVTLMLLLPSAVALAGFGNAKVFIDVRRDRLCGNSGWIVEWIASGCHIHP